jgi:hypothetical protein
MIMIYHYHYDNARRLLDSGTSLLVTIPVIIAGLSWLLWYRVRVVMVRNKKTSVAGCD